MTSGGKTRFWATTALLLLMADVSAQAPDRPFRGRRAETGGPQHMVPAERPASGPIADDPRPRGRMTPEERRQLRRDVHEAGRDLYPERMRRGRRGGDS